MVSHGEGSELEIMPAVWLTAVSSFQHSLQGDLPFSDHLLFPLLGVPTLDGSSKLWRYQGKSGFSHPLRGGKRPEVLRTPEAGCWGAEMSGEVLAGHEEQL